MLQRVKTGARPLVLQAITYASRGRFAGEDLQAGGVRGCLLVAT
jgi:hypothetical protein